MLDSRASHIQRNSIDALPTLRYPRYRRQTELILARRFSQLSKPDLTPIDRGFISRSDLSGVILPFPLTLFEL